jgi:2-amino-4-hydroxy-6-hydroxymethyldihydropteridine diphosphokinase
MTRAFVALGANLGERERAVRTAATWLGARRLSTLRETEPWGVTDQPRFVNAVAELDTDLDPRALLDELLAVEHRLGRVRGPERYGPRTIDLDLLLYGEETIDEPGLVVPHPRLHERRFMLEPLAELDPLLVIPGHGHVSLLLAKLQSTS